MHSCDDPDRPQRVPAELTDTLWVSQSMSVTPCKSMVPSILAI